MLPALIAGGASLLGGYLSNRAARQEAERNRQFQAEQTGTAWQRSVKDLEAAGLNPALAYSQGPAASGTGSMAAQHDIVSPAVSSALQARAQKVQLDQMRQATAKLSAETAAAEAVAGREQATNQLLGHHQGKDGKWRYDLTKGMLKDRMDAETAHQKFSAEALGLQLPHMRASAKALGAMPWSAYLKLLMGSGGAPLTTGMGAAGAAALLRR